MLVRLNRYFLIVAVLGLISFHMKAQQGSDENGFVQYLYPNDQVSSEGTMRDGKPDGYWKTYYVTGVIKSEGKRTNYLLDSIWNFYNQAGELTQQINYKLGEKSGYATSYSYNNPRNPGQPTVISSELYVNGRKEGNSYYYFPTGELKIMAYYKNGKKQGISREFSTDSTLIAVEEYNGNYLVNKERLNRTDPEGRKQGTYRNYYGNGRIKKEEHYLDDKLHGYYREFDGRGELVTAVRYERGMIMEEIDEDLKELLEKHF